MNTTFRWAALGLVVLAASQSCQRSRTGDGSVAATAFTPDNEVWFSVEFDVVHNGELFVAEGCRFEPEVHIYNAGTRLGGSDDPPVQTLVFPPNIVIANATAGIAGAAQSPPLLLLGCDEATMEGKVYSYLGEPGSLELAGELTLPNHRIPVTMSQDSEEFWWLASTDEVGGLQAHAVRDTDFDGLPDEITEFADFATLSAGYPEIFATLAAAPFDVQGGAAEQEVQIVQSGQVAFRMLDNDGDGIAEQALFRSLGPTYGLLISWGDDAGSEKVAIGGMPGLEVEVWETDADGNPLTPLGGGIIGDLSMAIVDVWPPLQDGQTLSVLNVASGRFGTATPVGASNAPTVVPMSDPDVALGGSITAYIASADLSQLSAEWVFMNSEDWPYTATAECSIHDLGSQEFQITVPDGETRHSPGYQLIRITSIDLPESTLIPINVDPVVQ